MTEEFTADDETLEVIVRPAQVRGAGRVLQLRYDDLSRNLHAFVAGLRAVFKDLPVAPEGFSVDEIELHAEVDAKGKLSLLGTGGEAGARGGIKLVFRRKPEA